MTLFNTLLLREWLQYKRAWIGLVLGPVLLLLALVPFSQVEGIDTPAPEPVALIAGLVTVALVLVLTVVLCGYQLMGLARRDQQDRSIEFWASLPGSHAASLGAPLLAHGLLVPLAATALAVLGGALIGTIMAFKEFGLAALHQTQWAVLLQVTIWMGLRLLVGLAVAALWLAPFVVALMAASAWLKRWGAPLLFIAVAAFLKIYKNEPAAEALARLLTRQVGGAAQAMFLGAQTLLLKDEGREHVGLQEFFDALFRLPEVARDTVPEVLQLMAQPQFIGGLVFAALCFGLLVLQRKRSL